MTDYEKVIVSLYTDTMMIDFERYRQYAEYFLGRKIGLSEYPTKKLRSALRKAVCTEFEKIRSKDEESEKLKWEFGIERNGDLEPGCGLYRSKWEAQSGIEKLKEADEAVAQAFDNVSDNEYEILKRKVGEWLPA